MWLVAAFALAGGLAQLVDGTLGMGFGVTSATVLLALGVAPATASAATHAAKLPTTLISGLSHWRVGNVDKAVFLRVAIPGAIGGFLGAVVLTSISLEAAKSGMAGLLNDAQEPVTALTDTVITPAGDPLGMHSQMNSPRPAPSVARS